MSTAVMLERCAVAAHVAAENDAAEELLTSGKCWCREEKISVLSLHPPSFHRAHVTACL